MHQDLSTLAIQSSYGLSDTHTAMMRLADLVIHKVAVIEEKTAILRKPAPASANTLYYGFDAPQNLLLTEAENNDAADQLFSKEER
jgi:hypothetical protein